MAGRSKGREAESFWRNPVRALRRMTPKMRLRSIGGEKRIPRSIEMTGVRVIKTKRHARTS